MRRDFLRGLVVVALTAFGIAGIAGVAAPEAQAAGGSGGGGGAGGGGGGNKLSFAGKISKIDVGSGTVTTDTTVYYNPSHVFMVGPSSVVTLNNKSATLADLKVGDTVSITVDDQSVIASTVKATR
jgi:hypothetical protein